jgi:peptide/nickel transport system permease protein
MKSTFLVRLGTQLLNLLLVVWLVSVLVFLALRLTPGDPAVLLLGPQAGRTDAAATLAHLRQQMGLDRSWIEQYGIWISQILQGDLGKSALNGVSVIRTIAGALPSTLWLLALSVLVSVPLSVLLGLWAAGKRNGLVDRVVGTFTTLAIAVPGVWLGLMAIIVFSVQLRLLPSGGYVSPGESLAGFLKSMVLPVCTLSVFLTGVLTRFVYTEGVEVLSQDYMRTASAMGIPKRRRLYRYAAKNAVIPMIAIVGGQLSALVGGAVLVEAVFGLGGLGQLLLSSVLNRDYQVVQGGVLLTTVCVMLVGFVADVAHRLVDPRIRA